VDPGVAAEELIASEIRALTGEDPEHEPIEAKLPSGVADFRFPADALGGRGRHILVEVKSLHDLVAPTRPWLLDYGLHHPDVPREWAPRDEWSAAGERRIRNLGVSPSDLTSLDALRVLTSIERLRGIAERGGQIYSLARDANQIAIMLLFGSAASLSPPVRWAERAVTRPFPGVITSPLDPIAVAFYGSNEGRRGVSDDIRLGLERKFRDYPGDDACLAVVVSDTDFEGSWAALLDGAVGYPIDGGEPVMQINRQIEIPGLVLAIRSREVGGNHGWSRRAAGLIERAENFEAVCHVALEMRARTD
jgi:hypothetical protein